VRIALSSVLFNKIDKDGTVTHYAPGANPYIRRSPLQRAALVDGSVVTVGGVVEPLTGMKIYDPSQVSHPTTGPIHDPSLATTVVMPSPIQYDADGNPLPMNDENDEMSEEERARIAAEAYAAVNGGLQQQQSQNGASVLAVASGANAANDRGSITPITWIPQGASAAATGVGTGVPYQQQNQHVIQPPPQQQRMFAPDYGSLFEPRAAGLTSKETESIESRGEGHKGGPAEPGGPPRTAGATGRLQPSSWNNDDDDKYGGRTGGPMHGRSGGRVKFAKAAGSGKEVTDKVGKRVPNAQPGASGGSTGAYDPTSNMTSADNPMLRPAAGMRANAQPGGGFVINGASGGGGGGARLHPTNPLDAKSNIASSDNPLAPGNRGAAASSLGGTLQSGFNRTGDVMVQRGGGGTAGGRRPYQPLARDDPHSNYTSADNPLQSRGVTLTRLPGAPVTAAAPSFYSQNGATGRYTFSLIFFNYWIHLHPLKCHVTVLIS
jgi:hypothetical protein